MFPVNVYRLQIGPFFGFKEARKILPLLHDLGINTVYLSPYQETVKNSLNPYEITRFDQVRKDVGGQKEYLLFCKKLKQYGMGQLMDLVVNHMARSVQNPWFYDVLQKGKASTFANYFDIDWKLGGNKIVLPILHEPLEEALKKKKVHLDGPFLVYDHIRYPLAKDSLDKGSIRPLSLQHYTWVEEQFAHEKINFRRFFDIHELIALRMENPEVFKSFHQWAFQQVKLGNVQGFRIDHPDGLFEPKKYFQQLRQHLPKDFYVVAEKILQYGEDLPQEWPVQGTVGYDYISALSHLFVQKDNEKSFTKLYQTFSQLKENPESLLYKEKVAYTRLYLRAEINRIVERLHPSSFSKEVLQESLIEILAYFPRYRSYGRKQDRLLWENVLIAWAKTASPPLVHFWKSFFLEKRRGPLMKCIEQLLPAIFAKGFEDTHLYVYNRLLSLNEVGGMPHRFGISIKEFHEINCHRNQHWPMTMTAGSTQDCKRSEDVRMRIHALSEMPELFHQHVHKWHQINLPLSQGIDRNTEYFFYQTLIGFWQKGDKRTLTKRLINYMIKASREAKIHTNWMSPNTRYEKTLSTFVKNVCSQPKNSFFWKNFLPFHQKIDQLGQYNSLSALVLRLGSGGVFHLFQGNECWTYALVDPDNRRPVSFSDHARLLKQGNSLKTSLLQKGLQFRLSHPDLFLDGSYIPLMARGAKKDHVVAFMRQKDRQTILVVSLRFYAHLSFHDPLWKSTYIDLPQAYSFTNIFTEKTMKLSRTVPLDQLIFPHPFAILHAH